MQQTTNYNLNVIEQSDKILDSVTALGQNATSIDTILAGKQDNITVATSISSSSTNSEVAGAKAVYDLHNSVDFVVCKNSAGQTISMPTAWATNKITIDTIADQSGDGFTINNGQIVVGSKPKVVEIYFHAYLTNLTSSKQYGVTVLLNGTSLGVIETIVTTTKWNYQKFYITNVKENDIIQLACRGAEANMSVYVPASQTSIIVRSISEVAPVSTRSLNLMKSANEEETEEKELEEKEPIEENKEKATEPAVEDIKEETNAEGSGDVK